MLYIIGGQDRGYHSKHKDGRSKHFLQPTIHLNIVKAKPLFFNRQEKVNNKRGEIFYAEVNIDDIVEFYRLIRSSDIGNRLGESYCLMGALTDYGIIPSKPSKREPLKNDIGISFTGVPKATNILECLESLVKQLGGEIYFSIKK
ncbi:hypothetical protein HYV89_02365 [Candidatus Woesearchaeota archaeon]|nr:hypothetical protein [Candidatus Woesearchaeota archaeon]